MVTQSIKLKDYLMLEKNVTAATIILKIYLIQALLMNVVSMDILTSMTMTNQILKIKVNK